jgi:hypothetical protein
VNGGGWNPCVIETIVLHPIYIISSERDSTEEKFWILSTPPTIQTVMLFEPGPSF